MLSLQPSSQLKTLSLTNCHSLTTAGLGWAGKLKLSQENMGGMVQSVQSERYSVGTLLYTHTSLSQPIPDENDANILPPGGTDS